ncbi:hypothetical protein FXN63_01130 [Pigmentiphaga aceris]|uniref:Uncharacterized protein n=1 Tax=Pigmentiphaga aceris TaxID=1940612 RepID=A0A5C0AUL6_9BURK|nr:hypothetical protein [Pigmentiphaga aceris]QEI04590.1 hypothetical protein FXN63_01130 [Pigmentiphaga aceris]
MAIFLLLWLLSLVALIVLCVKGLRLAFRPAARAEACRRWLMTVSRCGWRNAGQQKAICSTVIPFQ